MALGFILAATAAAPVMARPATLDTSFGTDGYAVSAFGAGTGTESAVTTVGPGGVIVSAALTEDHRRGVSGDGLHVIQRSASGQQLDADFVAFRAPTAWVHDVRKLADGRVITAGQTAEGNELWIAVVDAQGTAGPILTYDAPGDCSVQDAVVHPSGQVVVAFNCSEGTDIRVLAVGDFSVPKAAPVTRLGEDVVDLALAPDGSVAMLAQLPSQEQLERRVTPPYDAKVGRLDIGTKTWSLDEDFGEEGWTFVRGFLRLTVDGANRPVAAGYDLSGDEYAFSRVKPGGGLDESFDQDGVSEVDGGPMYHLEALGTDEQHRVLFGGRYFVTDETQTFRATVQGTALARLTDGGKLDADFGDGGRWVFDDEGPRISGLFDPVAASDGAIATFGFGRPFGSRAAVPAPSGQGSLVLAKIGLPRPPATEQQQPSQGQPQPQAQPAAISTTVASTTRKTGRTCLSRRSFTIRLRPRSLRSAQVKVAGKRAKVTRRNGRLTARVDLRKMQQAAFDVAVTGRTAKGRRVSETRTYRTCRVGEKGRKVQGGSIIFTVS